MNELTFLREAGARINERWRGIFGTPITARIFDRYLIGMLSTSQLGFDYVDPAGVRENVTVLHEAARWESIGAPTFNVTHGLAAALMLTDCGGVVGSDLRFPFESFAVRLPTPNTPITIMGTEDDATPLPAECITVSVNQTPGSVDQAEVLTVELPLAQAAIAEFQAATAPLIAQASGMSLKEMFAAIGRARDNGIAKVAVLERSTDLHLTIISGDLTINAMNRIPSGDTPIDQWLDIDYKEGDHVMTLHDKAAVKAAFRLVANLCFYINSRHAENGASGIAALEKISRRPPNTWVVGREVKLPAELLAAARVSSTPSDPKWKLNQRMIVRGHWKNQICGPGRVDHKRIWIAPYWRGPEDAEIMQRAYAVDQL